MNQTDFKELEAKFVKDKLERGRVDRAIRKVFRAGKIKNEGAALGCLYAALKDGEKDNPSKAVSEALLALLPADCDRVVSKLKSRFSVDELQAGILWNLGISGELKLSPPPTFADFSRIATDILNLEAGDRVLNMGAGQTFMEAAFAAQPGISYSELEDSRHLYEMEILRTSLLDFQKVSFPIVLSADEYTKAFVVPPYEDWQINRIGENADPLFDGRDVSEASMGWNHIAEVLRSLQPGGTMAAAVPAGILSSPGEESVRRFLMDRQLLKMVVVLPHSRASATPYSSLLILGDNDGGPVRFVNALKIERSARNRWTSDEWNDAVLNAVHTTGGFSADIPTDTIRKEGYDWFPVKYMLLQRFDNIAKLRDVATSVLRGSQLKKDVLEDFISDKVTSIRCVFQRDLDNELLRPEDLTTICLSHLPEGQKSHTVPNHAVLLSKISVSDPSSAVVEKDDTTTLLAMDNLYVIELDETKLNPYYLQAYLASDEGAAALRSISSGTQMLNLSQANLLELPVPLLPMEKQREIGDRYRTLAYERLDLHRQAALRAEAMKDIWKEDTVHKEE